MEAVTSENTAGIAGYYDPEKTTTGDHYRFSETTPTYIRHEFVKKVFGIVGLQLLFSYGFMFACYYTEPARLFFLKNRWIGVVGLLIFAITSLVVACKPASVHNTTNAFLFISFMTLLMSLYLTSFCVAFFPFEIFIACGITLGVVFALTLFAMQTKYDFTQYLTYALVICICLIFFSIFAMIFRNKVLNIVYSTVGALVISFYLLIDVQLVVGGKKYEWTTDDYALASIVLYSDVISLFIHILSLVGNSS
ncbi:hypothetical protein BEWA_002470 [Theileria equi strain WA]|uniref:Nmda receptor glutamate-binding chain n=1 Tax=Theileria equi strain WA TaxID=1537102 RepID=L0AZ54_THEEQ|nr:hypothetical protein BEWA_002470 [Theileria equi strain WA]AFZ80840.1 hypothetical protein BEWA_002470 [Theileria equi strain WA]|eukprot:XP_004830506.1 hypothetical protein BEWA_002470 [Theileria equi strain WA]